MKKSEAKRQKVDASLARTLSYSFLYRILSDNKSPYIQSIRKALKQNDSAVVFGKYKMAEKVLAERIGRERFQELQGQEEGRFKGSGRVYYYAFSNSEPLKVSSLISSVEYSDYEKASSLFAEDVFLRKGEILNTESVKISNTLFKDLKQCGLEGAVVNPKTNNIELAGDTVLGRKGEVIGEREEKIMKILGIKNRKYASEIVGKVCLK